ncbi:MAG: alginate biosynthesis protein AlgK [Pseudomonas sp.]|uniref:alginate biosynthesis protein AlgK n=1 Tax=Pseudomonas sp. TaxID=306 RepID=UPI0033983286
MFTTQRLLLLTALGLGGCAGLPDQQLAQQALKNGDTVTAERHYRQLAELGYADAQVGLADLQVASGDAEQLRLAEQTYRQALDNSPRAKARLGKLLAGKPTATDAERIEAEGLLREAFEHGEQGALVPLATLYLNHARLFAGVDLESRLKQWRQAGFTQVDLVQIQLYRSQGSYDQHLAEIEQICVQALPRNDACYLELATVYQKGERGDDQAALLERLKSAYAGGSVPASRVEDVALVLANAELGKTDETTAQALLEEIAPAYPAAWVSLARLLYEYPALGSVEKIMEYLEAGKAAAVPRAELLLGKLHYEGKLVPRDPQKAEQHLLQAALSESSAHYYLGQIYLRGYLGQIAPDKAVEHLLVAARAGQASADFALAQLFSQGKGFQVNRVNAYVFSQLAVHTATAPLPERQALAQAIDAQLQPQERPQALQLLREEQQLRGAAAVPDGALQAMQLKQVPL